MQMLCLGQKMRVYAFTIYIINVECGNIMFNHHLQLVVGCDFTYATNKFLINEHHDVHCIYNRKL